MSSATATRGQESQQAALDRAKRVSTLLDDAIELPVVNYRIGIDPIVGILPVAGDSLMALLSLYIVFEGIRAGASARLVALMLSLVAVDAIVGSIPVLGSVFDAVWKANTWNVRLLERHVAEKK